MKKMFFSASAVVLMASAMVSCSKSSVEAVNANGLSQDEKALIASAGFDAGWAEKKADGTFLIEGDMNLTKEYLHELANTPFSHNFVVANTEHYRTTNIVSTPSSGQRTITVRLGSGFNSFFGPGLDASLTRYNNLNLKIRFQRVTTGGNLVISASNLGTSGTSCILGQASGFPSGGNPSSGFTLSNSTCANNFFNSSAKADEVIMHEIGHCIGFRHTDYTTRKSCGENRNEGTAGIGAVFIAGTPTASQVAASDPHWMMACTNGDPRITNGDVTALNTVY